MVRSPRKAKNSRNIHEISREICGALKEVYYDSSKDIFKSKITSLLKMYQEESEIRINKNEYITEFSYRTGIFLDGSMSQEGQYRVFKFLALLASKCYIEHGDFDLLDSLFVTIQTKKENDNPAVRKATVALIGRIFYCTLKVPEDGDIHKSFASHLEERIFTEMYSIVWALAADLDEDVRAESLYAVQKLQKYEGLMANLDSRLDTIKNLFALGIRDPSEIVRCKAISCFDVANNNDVKLILEALIIDKSPMVRLAVAKKLATDVPVALLRNSDRKTILDCKELFLGDTIIPEYYDIIYSWAHDSYCQRYSVSYDLPIQIDQVLSGFFDLMDSLRFYKDLLQICLRFFEHLKSKFFTNTGPSTYVAFAQTFVYERTPYLNASNYEELLDFNANYNINSHLKEKMDKLFLWQVLGEFCCHPSLAEETVIECRTVLFPTMADYVKFARTIWDTLNIALEDISAITERHTVMKIQNACAKIVLNIFHVLDREDACGKSEWKMFLNDMIIEQSFKYEDELMMLLVHDYFHYHFNVNEDHDAFIIELADLIGRIGEIGELHTTQDEFRNQTRTNVSQIFSQTLALDETQLPHLPVSTMDPLKQTRLIQVLASAFKNGFILKYSPILDGLITDYAIFIFDHHDDIEARQAGYFCVAGMVPLMDQEKTNFVKSARTILEDSAYALEIKKAALMMLSDSIPLYGYQKVNELYFKDANESENCNLLEYLISLCDDENIGTTVIRRLLQMIGYQYDLVFHDALIYLLTTVFTSAGDGDIRILLVYYFTTFAHISRENQCALGTVCVDALLKLADSDLEADEARVNIDEMITFVSQITSFSVLHPNAFGREYGSSHLHLATRILLRLDKVFENGSFLEYFCSLLQKCEVSEIYDNERIDEILKACMMRRDEVDTNRHKKYIEGFMKRVENAIKHAESKKAIARPPVIQKSSEEIKQEMQQLFDQMILINENTGPNKCCWERQSVPINDNPVLHKMKIFGEHPTTIEQIRHRFLGKHTPLKTSLTGKRTNSRRPTTTPRKKIKEAQPSRSVISTPVKSKTPVSTRSTRRRPLKETLNSVPEEVEEIDYVEC